jgi:ATP-dependent HslUV protease subunit HslV
MEAEAVARKAMEIAAGICIYTNENVVLQSITAE